MLEHVGQRGCLADAAARAVNSLAERVLLLEEEDDAPNHE
jgi:hypothetical protein